MSDHEKERAESVREANYFAADRLAEQRQEAVEAAAEIANDRQALLAHAEEIFLKWAKNGWLNQDADVVYYDDAERIWRRRPGKNRTPLEASGHHAQCIDDSLVDALSRDARELIEIAGGK